VEGIDCLVVFLVGESSEDARSVCHELTVSGELCGDVLPLETSVFGKNPIPSGPTGYGDVDDGEFLSKEVRPTDIVGEALEIFDPFV